mmetsp:Transcript_22004/g.67714  ORF Transcript_22004/g.67714 Transcript_22004/m.67714 type:complete len:230 (+) Transcript_22004:420-1109(+)
MLLRELQLLGDRLAPLFRREPGCRLLLRLTRSFLDGCVLLAWKRRRGRRSSRIFLEGRLDVLRAEAFFSLVSCFRDSAALGRGGSLQGGDAARPLSLAVVAALFGQFVPERLGAVSSLLARRGADLAAVLEGGDFLGLQVLFGRPIGLRVVADAVLHGRHPDHRRESAFGDVQQLSFRRRLAVQSGQALVVAHQFLSGRRIFGGRRRRKPGRALGFGGAAAEGAVVARE